MKNFMAFYLPGLILVTTLGGCSKKETPDPAYDYTSTTSTTKNCLLSYYKDDFETIHSFEYDSTGRLIKYVDSLGMGQTLTYNYQNNFTVQITQTDGSAINKSIGKIGNNGYFSSVYHSDSSRFTIYEYDKDGYLVKQIFTIQDSPYSDTTIYQIKDGNTISKYSKVTSGDYKMTSKIDYVFYTDKKSNNIFIDLITSPINCGKPNLNLIKGSSLLTQSNYPSINTQTIDYTYEFNTQGYAKNVTMNINSNYDGNTSSGKLTNHFFYICP